MREIKLLFGLILITPFLANAQQLVVSPQVGIQTSNTKTVFNNSPYVSSNGKATGYAGLRINYQTVKGHGPYIGFSLGTSTITYKVASTTPGLATYHSSMTDVFRVELGYQWNTKAIYFKRLWDNQLGYEEFSKLKQKGWSMRVQPYAGISLLTRNTYGPSEMVYTSGERITNYYNRRGYAISTGVNLEFGKNDKPVFNLGINFINSLGVMQSTRITKSSSGVNYQTDFFNRGSGFNITLGVPLIIFKKRN